MSGDKSVQELVAEGRLSFACLGKSDAPRGEFEDSGDWGWFAGSGSERRILTIDELIEIGKAKPIHGTDDEAKFEVVLDAYFKCLLYRKDGKYNDDYLNTARFVAECILLGLGKDDALEIYKTRGKELRKLVDQMLSEAKIERKFIKLSRDIPVRYQRVRHETSFKDRLFSRLEMHKRRIEEGAIEGAGRKSSNDQAQLFEGKK